MNKRWFILLALVMTLSLVLVACQGQVQEAVQEAAPTIEAAVEEVAPTVEAAVEEVATEIAEEPAEEPAEVAAGSVGIVLPTREEPRWIQDETRFQEAFDAAGYEVEILFSEGDPAKERANVEDLLTKGVQVIILTPHDGTAAGAAAEAARDAGVKVIAYDRLILDTEAVDYYVTFDSIAVGAAQAQYLVDKASGSGNPLYLYAGAATDNNAFLFFEGAWNVLQPKIADGTFVIKNSSEAEALADTAELTRDEMANIIGQITTEWDFDTAKSLAEANLTATTAEDKGDVFILAPNDGTARAIADAFAADADVSSYVVTGQDAEIASVQYIIDGKQSMTVLKDVRTLVGDAIAAAIAYLEGGTPEQTNTYNNGVIDVPAKPSEVIAVDQANVVAAIIDSGYWPADEFTGLDAMGVAEEPAEEEATPAMAYAEAPMLADMVAAGDLPPVEERLPAEPLVQEVVDEVGQYGGTLRRAFLGPGDHNNYTRVVYDALVRYAPDGSEVIPHIAKGWESNDDFSEWTVFLREGMKWSDGEPFTADDILWWYDNILLNEDLNPTVPLWMQNTDGSTAVVEKVDDYTVVWKFAGPNTAFLLDLANKDGADRAISNLAFVPAHYLEQYHPDFADEAELQAKVEEAGFDTWVELFAVQAFPHMSGTRPTTAAWMPTGTSVADQVFTLSRNPYYFAVDPEGNQLPYIDEVRFTFFADPEALNLAAVAGEIDMQGRHINMSSFPVLKENEEAGNYRVVTWPTFGGSDAVVMLNQTWIANEPELGALFQEKDFRVALSHAIDREAIKESAFFGIGEARQPVPAPFHPYYPGDEYAFKYTELDLDTSNALLDGLGLTARDDEGFRTLPSGERLDIEVGVVPQFANWPDIAQLIVDDWAEVGIRAHVELRERNTHFAMRPNNELVSEIWNDDTTGFPFSGQPKQDIRSDIALTWGPLYRVWYETDGAEGLEPPDDIKRMVEIIDEAKVSDSDRQIELAQELFRLWVDSLYEIGTVGLTPMVQGVLVVNDNLMNVPDVAGNDWPLRTPGDTRPEQYFFAQ